MRPRPTRAALEFLAASVVVLTVARPAAAQPLVTDQFNVDLYQGPILGSSRVIGLGGAYAALAEEAVGIQFNPAAVAHRTWYSRGPWDWDLTADWLLPNIARSKQFTLDTSSLPTDTTSFWVLNVGGLLQYKSFGVGFYANIEAFERRFDGFDGPVTFGFNTYHAAIGYGFLDQQLVAAVGLRVGTLTATGSKARNLFDLTAAGAEAGVLVRPERLPLRFGAAFYSALQRQKDPDAKDDANFPGLAMPHSVTLPWQITAGVAWELSRMQMNPRPDFTPRPRAPKRRPPSSQPASQSGDAPGSQSASAPAAPPEPPRAAGGYYLLLTLDVQVSAPVANAVGMTSFLSGQRETSGASYSVSVRFGAEGEVWQRRLRLRAGTYWEPSRFESTAGRMHGTCGLDVRVFDFKLWGPRSLRAGLSGDFARNYTNAGVSLGLWH